MGQKYNYITAMYYIHNKNILGEQKALVYANKYIYHNYILILIKCQVLYRESKS